MSMRKTTYLVFALLIAAAVVFLVSGTGRLNASSSNESTLAAAAANSGDGNTASCTKSVHTAKTGCTRTAMAGCPASAAGCCAKSGSKSACSMTKTAKTADISPIEGHDGTRMVLVGRYVCGHCDLGVLDRCQAAFRTTDGNNYLLAQNNYTKELRQTARDKDVEIVTHVQKYDGVKYLEVDVVRSI